MKHYPTIAQSIGITGIVILGMLVFSPVQFVLTSAVGKEASLLVYYILSIGFPFWIVQVIRKSKNGQAPFALEIKNPRLIPFVVIASLSLLFGVISPLVSLIPMPDMFKKIFLEMATMNGIFPFLLMVVAAPILEELIFRGIILDGLLKQYTPVMSITVSSFLFGFVHLNPWQFVTGFVIGLFSGWVYFKTRSLTLSIIIHAAVNLCGYSMRFVVDPVTSIDESLTETYGGTTNLVLVLAGAIALFAGSMYFLRREFDQEETNPSI